MKKTCILAVSLLLALALTACGNSSTEATPEQTETTQQTQPSAEVQAPEPENTTAASEYKFEDCDILKFEYANPGNPHEESYGSIKTRFNITNTGDEVLPYVSADFFYRDANGNALAKDGRYFDGAVYPGTSFAMDSYVDVKDVSLDQIAEVVVESYEYEIYDSDTGKTFEYRINTVFKTVEVYEQ